MKKSTSVPPATEVTPRLNRGFVGEDLRPGDAAEGDAFPVDVRGVHDDPGLGERSPASASAAGGWIGYCAERGPGEGEDERRLVDEVLAEACPASGRSSR